MSSKVCDIELLFTGFLSVICRRRLSLPNCEWNEAQVAQIYQKPKVSVLFRCSFHRKTQEVLLKLCLLREHRTSPRKQAKNHVNIAPKDHSHPRPKNDETSRASTQPPSRGNIPNNLPCSSHLNTKSNLPPLANSRRSKRHFVLKYRTAYEYQYITVGDRVDLSGGGRGDTDRTLLECRLSREKGQVAEIASTGRQCIS